MEQVVSLDIAWWSLIASVFLPLVVAVVTKELASSRVKSIALIVLSAINGVVSSAIENTGILTKETLVAALISLAVAGTAYYNAWRPTGATPAIAEKTANVGVG